MNDNDTPADAMELKPCPFCGEGDAVIHPPPADAKGLHILASQAPYYGHCDGCGADGPPRGTEEEAIAEWDTRASLAAQDGLVEALRILAEEIAGIEQGDQEDLKLYLGLLYHLKDRIAALASIEVKSHE